MTKSVSTQREEHRAALRERFDAVRQTTEQLARPLATEDYGLQAMADTSPPKWHLAHTTWFFETFVLAVYAPGYQPFHPQFKRLFNSYYETVGQFWPRAIRGLLSRPTVEQIYQYRHFVEDAIHSFIDTSSSDVFGKACDVITLGLHHEQQHQELLMTDIQYNLSINPLKPVYREAPATVPGEYSPASWQTFPSGIVEIGYRGAGFAFDNELPVHRQWLDSYRIQDRLITNREYLEFMEDGGYRTPTLWLSSGWACIQSEHWQAPLYWTEVDGEWQMYTLGGERPIDRDAPVSHVSYFEADAYAHWAGKRLCREGEWETAAGGLVPQEGNFLEDGGFLPISAPLPTGTLRQMFGDVWEWTESAYGAYPGFHPELGALGEYNGKFMSGQQVLRGGSCVTPRSHIRATYRNFFPPQTRWQFSGIRLAEDVHE